MPQIILNKKFYTLEEIAKQVGLSIVTLRSYIKQNKLKAQKIGRAFHVREDNLKRFMQINE